MTTAHRIKALIRHLGVDVLRAKPNREDILRSRSIDTVIDVGANEGGFADEIRSTGYRGQIVSFEPIPEVFEILSQRFAHDSKWKGFNVGISSASGTAEIGVTEYSVFSSLHAQNPAAERFHKQSKVLRKINVQLITLDEMFSKIPGGRLFLKIDTQGHERACLEGARHLLNRVQAVQLELPISKLYQDTWDMGDAVSFMKLLGFVPCVFAPLNFHGADPVAMVEVDCIFRRHDPAID
ncbi:MAG: FkbM family methyltransferase [Methylovirgula sp.]|uniref:FkbM family methyltransferase n=1 Tax=Methylovirgula sp. TaxID=1978224 RepID=UPI0030763ABE